MTDPAGHRSKFAWIVVGALVGVGGTVLSNRLLTYHSSLAATVRFGPTPPATAADTESGYFDITVKNDGDKSAAGVWLDIPDAKRAWVVRGGQADAWIEPVKGRLKLGNMPPKDSARLIVSVPNPPSASSGERIVLSQDEGGGSVTLNEWKAVETKYAPWVAIAIVMGVALVANSMISFLKFMSANNKYLNELGLKIRSSMKTGSESTLKPPIDPPKI